MRDGGCRRRGPAPDLPDGLVSFDGVRLLCSAWVRSAARFRVVAEEPATSAAVLSGPAFSKSNAALAVLRHLPGWRWTAALPAPPRPLRDWLYDGLARGRHGLFGRADARMVPAPDLRARSLGGGRPGA